LTPGKVSHFLPPPPRHGNALSPHPCALHLPPEHGNLYISQCYGMLPPPGSALTLAEFLSCPPSSTTLCKQQVHNDIFPLTHNKLPLHDFGHLKRLLLPNRMCHLHPSCRCLGVGLMLLDAFWEIFHEHITGAHATPSAAPSLQFNPSSFPPSHFKIYETC
jgi:hypothetical protein